jgi:2-keto-4-pentenoate hydratase
LVVADSVASPARPFARILGKSQRTDHVAQLLGVRALEAEGKAPAGLVRFGLGPDKLAYAYALQDELMAKLITPTNRHVGWKIGFSMVEAGRAP